MILDDIQLQIDTPSSGWVDITGPGHSVTITRTNGQPGTMVAEVLDATLDPTQTAEVRMGRQARLRCRDAAGTGWVAVYTGALDDVQVTRNPFARPGKTVTVQLSAVDAVAQLANTPESRGVAAIDHLRWLVTGVPFVINGQSTALGAQTVVAGNDNASLWDQVLITRDSALGYAWVDPQNRLQVWDAAQLPAGAVAMIGPDRYSNIDTDFTLDSIVNSVTVLFRRYNIGTETSVDVAYGPYEDAASIASWGRRTATFTIQAEVEDEVAIEAYATDVLSRSATAVSRVRSVRVPIRETADLDLVRDIDLNSAVDVVLTDGVTVQSVRIAGVSHSITERGWFVEFTCEQPQSTSAPLSTPGTGFSEIPPGTVGETELDPVVVSTIENATPLGVHNQAVSDIEADIAATNQAVVDGDTANSQEIDQAVADFNAGLATKSKHTLSANAPGVTANNAGDVWERHKSGDTTKIIGRWRGMGGTSWSPMDLDATYIPQLDIGTGTFGDLSGARLLARTVGAETLVISGFNLVDDPRFEAWTETWAADASLYFSRLTEAHGYSMDVRNGTSQNRHFGPVHKAQVEPGDAFVMQMDVYNSYGAGYIGLFYQYLDEAGGVVASATIRTHSTAYNTWNTIDADIPPAPAGARRINFLPLISGPSTRWLVRSPVLRQKQTGKLIVDGAILAKHVSADMVEGLLVTGRVLQTDAAANRGIKISTSGLIGYDTAGVARTVISPSTGLISAEGTLQAGSSSGEFVRIRPDGSAGVIEFFTGVSGETAPGVIDPELVGGTLPAIRIKAPTSSSYSTSGVITVWASAAAGGVDISGQLNMKGSLDIKNASGVTKIALVNNGYLYAQRLISETWQTTGSAANTFMNSTGELVKSTSSRRYKTDITPDLGVTTDELLALQPKAFRHIEDASGREHHLGFIAEEAHDLGLTHFVDYDTLGRPDGFQYATWTAALQHIAREHAAQITELRTRLDALEGVA